MKCAMGWMVLLTLVLTGCNTAVSLPQGSDTTTTSSDSFRQQVIDPKADWTPKVGKPYPDLTLINEAGQLVQLSSYKGKVLLIEPIGMTCPACQAFAGANTKGGYGGVSPASDLESIDVYLPRYGGGQRLDDSDLVYVQLILYNMAMAAPTAADLTAWAHHFGGPKNRVVLGGTPDLLGSISYSLIPGFQVVDRDFILQSDGAGHTPVNNPYTEVMPVVKKLIQERRKG